MYKDVLSGIVVLLLNICSRYVVLEFSDNQKEFLAGSFFRQLFIFLTLWAGTNNVVLSIILLTCFHILSNILLNENHHYCVFSSKKADNNNNKKREEINNTIQLLESIRDKL